MGVAKSRRKRTDQVLVLGVLPEELAESILLDIANLRDPKHWRKVFGRYPAVFPETAVFKELCARATWLRDLLRKAWDAQDSRRRDWYIHQAESSFHKWRTLFDQTGDLKPEMVKGMLGADYLEPDGTLFNLRIVEPPEQATALEAVLFYFRRRSDHARYCPNENCAGPYFFVTKKGQRFCSPECANPSRRAAKLRWYHNNK